MPSNRSYVVVSLDPTSVEKVSANLRQFTNEMRNTILASAIHKAADIPLAQAIMRAPVRTGRLVFALGKRRIRDPGAIGSYISAYRRGGAPYAHLVEYGHRIVVRVRRRSGFGTVQQVKGHVPARPFLRPALETTTLPVLSSVAENTRLSVDRMKGRR